MIDLIYVFLAQILILSLTVFIQKKFKILIDKPLSLPHKTSSNKETPLIGSIYFPLSFFIISFFYKIYESNNLIYFIILFSGLGLLGNFEKILSSKKRLFFQIILIILFTYISNLEIDSVGVTIFDELLNFYFINILFTSFCLVLLINGTNFIDGINLNVSLYFLATLLTVYFIIDTNIENLEIINFSEINLLKYLIVSLIVFILFNSFGFCFLGDGGCYVVGVLSSIIIIKFINFSETFTSPFLAPLILWYPCYETLFSIITKKKPFEADTLHLHILVFKYLKKKMNYKNKFINSLSGITMNIINLPIFLIGYLFYDNSIILIISLFLFNLLYLSIYFFINKKMSN